MRLSKTFLSLATGLALLGAAPLAGAQTAPTATSSKDQDLRCFVVMGRIAAVDDKDTAQAGAIGMLYFTGKLDGQGVAEKALEDQAFAISQKMSDEALQKEAGVCGDLLEKRGAALSSMGDRIGVREEAAAKAAK